MNNPEPLLVYSWIRYTEALPKVKEAGVNGALEKGAGIHPAALAALIGGGLGLGSAAFSSRRDEDGRKNKPWIRNALIGAGLGGLLGYGADRFLQPRIPSPASASEPYTGEVTRETKAPTAWRGAVDSPEMVMPQSTGGGKAENPLLSTFGGLSSESDYEDSPTSIRNLSAPDRASAERMNFAQGGEQGLINQRVRNNQIAADTDYFKKLKPVLSNAGFDMDNPNSWSRAIAKTSDPNLREAMQEYMQRYQIENRRPEELGIFSRLGSKVEVPTLESFRSPSLQEARQSAQELPLRQLEAAQAQREAARSR